MIITRIASVFLSGAIAFAAAYPVQAATPEDNKAQLLKTNSCPGCNLSGVNLNRAELAGADLQGADLSDAKLMLANLAGANLQKAKLKGVKLGGADLANADLRGAEIDVSALNGAYYKGAAFDATIAEALHRQEPEIVEGEDGTPTDTDTAAPRPVEQQMSEEPQGAADAKGQPVSVEPEPAVKEVREPTHQDFTADDQSAINESVPVAPDAENVSIRQAEGNDAQDPAAENVESGDSQGQPAESDLSTGDAPAVKTIQPIGEIVIAESASVEEKSEAAVADTVGEGAVYPQQEDAVEESAVLPETQEERTDATEVEAPPEEIEDTDQSVAAAEQEPTPPADTAKMERLARLIKEKRCYGCDLSGMDLSDMRLKKADLEGADLSGCNLEGAALDAANLKGAILRQANLKKASMKGADLYRADLTAADLTEANLDEALIDDAVFTDAIGLSEEIGKNVK